jgi:hypothetical protein
VHGATTTEDMTLISSLRLTSPPASARLLFPDAKPPASLIERNCGRLLPAFVNELTKATALPQNKLVDFCVERDQVIPFAME